MRLLARAVLLATVFLPAISVADNTWSACTTITALTNEMADGDEFIVTLAGTNPVGSCIWEGAPAVFFTVGSDNVDSTNISSLLATALVASSQDGSDDCI